MYPTFRQTFVHILYTKFSWHSSFDFVCKMSAKVCWNLAYILYTSVVYILYSFSTQNVYTVFVWEIFKRRVFKNVTNFTGKDVLESNFSKVAGLTLLKTNSNRCFPVKFAEFLKTAFFHRALPVATSTFIRSTHALWIKLIYVVTLAQIFSCEFW